MKRLFADPWFLMLGALVLILGFSLFAFGFGFEGSTAPPETNTSSGSSSSSTAGSQLQPLTGLEISPQPFDFGEVSMKKGIISQTFSLKNKTGKNLEVSKIETSCMCTEASLKVGDKESPFFGMPGHTANPVWQATIPPDGEAVVTAKFDPNAHGPEGAGLVKRVVRVFFSDPQSTYADINFSADVVK